MNEPWKPAAVGLDVGSAEGPYPGLRPFLPREREIFFGREQMIDQVLVRLNERHMVVVHGASGCGKSSLIAAGVLPQLARRRARLGRVLAVRTFRPGISPTQKLVQTLAELCGPEKRPVELEVVYRALARDRDARAEVARLAADAGVDQLCIVIDQFEELFRFAEDGSLAEAQHFAELLVRLAGQNQDEARWWEEQSEGGPAASADEATPCAEISFILTMRSEFLGNCARYRGLAEAINHTQYLLPNMARADLIRAIREPTEVFDGSVDHALAERMADDAAREEDSLPLVQHALMQMWCESDSKRLTLADYEAALDNCALCGQAKQRGPLAAILAGHADRVLADVTGGENARLSAAEFMFRALSRKDSESRAIRCPQRFSRLLRLSGVSEEETRAIIDGFRAEGVSFLMPYAAMGEAIDGDTVIDISHEALIRIWPRMSEAAIDKDSTVPIGWVEREAQAVMMWRWISVQAELFRSNPEAFLDLTTNKRLAAWFERIKPRPEWARPHLVKPTYRDEVTEEPEWKAVENLLVKSFKKTRLDRLFLRWWKAGGLLFFTVALVATCIVLSWYIYSYHSNAEALRVQRKDVTEQVKSTVRASNSALDTANRRAGTAPPAQTEIVDEGTAAAATAGGSFINTTNGQGYIWIGTVELGNAADINPAVVRNLSTSPDKAHRNASYWIIGDTIVRRNRPNPQARPVGVGIIASRSLVRVVERPIAVPAEGRIDYWARVQLAQTDLPRVRVYLANVPSPIAAQMAGQLTNIGYGRPSSPSASVDATGHTEVVYCHQIDRAAAVQLATTVTRWIAQNTRTRGVTVTPLRGDSCGGVAPKELTLLLDLAPRSADSADAL